MATRVKNLFGSINGEERSYVWYSNNKINGFYYTDYNTEHSLYSQLVLYYNQQAIEVRRPATAVSEYKAMPVVFDLLVEMVNSGYTGKTESEKLVTRNQSLNKFNPIREVELDGALYLVEYQSRAKRFIIRKAKKYAEKKYTTRVWKHIDADEYEYVGEMS